MVTSDLGLGRVGQIGIVVRDIRASIEAYWRTLGIGPWKVYTNGPPPLRNVTYYGRPASYRVRVALAHTETGVVELIQYLEGDSIHRDFLATHGEGVEHLGIYVPNLDEALARYRSQGLTALQMGIVSGNPGLEELIAAGARLDPATARAYADAYKKNPKALALVKKASGQ